MKALGRLFATLFEDRPQGIDSIYRDWDRLRAEALTPSHRAEIDAIFSRQV
jgi:hypothetical protein